MRNALWSLVLVLVLAGTGHAAVRSITMQATPQEAAAGSSMNLVCSTTGDWLLPLASAKVTIKNPSGVNQAAVLMKISGNTASYDYRIPAIAASG